MIPYIGITDFTCFEQVERMHSVFERHRKPNQNRRLHVGVMMSYKTLHGLPTKWINAFPLKETIASIFASDETMNCLHYADYEGIAIYDSLTKALEFGGSGITALQLDMVWPDPEAVGNAVLASGKKLEVILQVNEQAMREVNDNPNAVVSKLFDYQGIIEHVLLDKSMGRGIGINAEKLLPYIYAAKESFPKMGITVAGGLGPDTIELLAPITERFSDVSIDAQGRLRPSKNALDPIDWSMAKNYLMKGLEFLD